MDHYLEPKNIIWISLGSFRYMPELKPIIRKRHPKTCILDGEFIMGLDGKMRYFKPLRMELYAFLAERLNLWCGDMGLYLCMEPHDVWEASLGWSPRESKRLADYLDQRVIGIFGGNPAADML
jgi:spore photoproduct lyase